MNQDLFIDSTSGKGVVLALLEDRKLVELNSDDGDAQFSVGDLYLGKVKKVMGGLNAAFVDVGYEKDAFLHYLDLGAQYKSLNKLVKSGISNQQIGPLFEGMKFEKDIDKSGKITNVLASKQNVLVQIVKEPISTKGPRIGCELALAGRFLVLIPFTDKISISQRIGSAQERNRLKRLIQSIKPKNFGVIIRTVAENKKVAELNSDLNELVERWKQAYGKLKTAKPPEKVLGEINRTSAILRDMLSTSFNSIFVDDKNLYEEVRSYIRAISPEQEKIVKYYTGKTTLFDHFGVDRQIKSSFGKFVTMKSRAYLVIEHTEALHVIDVNSGSRSNADNDQEANALAVNLDSAEEIARQLRLRDMGGIIVVDFIDMYKAENRKKLHDKMKDAMSRDRAKHKILPPSRFGLIQITRQRVRPEMNITTAEKCPTCKGTGEIQPSELIIDEIENNISYFFKEQNESAVTICVHPFIEAYLNRGIMSSVAGKGRSKYKKKIKVQAESSHQLLEIKYFNSKNEQIKT
ncbi:MAG: Rne/Rng family ribonuclease [Flavobacteriales bacterium]|nr:Rne/Rng family ribonuclease [Flavobacteriales bacterium]